MTSETSKVKARLATLSSSLDDLETQLEPLFAQTLPETIVALEPIQQAKLQTLLPYLIYDLVFIYLKSKGLDPRTHPVVPELDRIREYFEKISSAENPANRRTGIDKAAAERFIKHAITQAVNGKTPADDAAVPSESDAGPSTPRVPVKVTSKMLERAQYEKEVRERDKEDSEEDELEVFEDEGAFEAHSETVPEANSGTDAKGKGKAKDNTLQSSGDGEKRDISLGQKRRRPAIDPFTGQRYEEEASTARRDGKDVSAAPSPPETRPKKKKKALPLTGASKPMPAADSAPGTGKLTKAEKKARKQAKLNGTS